MVGPKYPSRRHREPPPVTSKENCRREYSGRPMASREPQDAMLPENGGELYNDPN